MKISSKALVTTILVSIVCFTSVIVYIFLQYITGPGDWDFALRGKYYNAIMQELALPANSNIDSVGVDVIIYNDHTHCYRNIDSCRLRHSTLFELADRGGHVYDASWSIEGKGRLVTTSFFGILFEMVYWYDKSGLKTAKNNKRFIWATLDDGKWVADW